MFGLRGLIIAAAVTTAAPLLGSTTATAASPSISSAAAWRECTNVARTGCAVRGTVASGTTATMHCWIDDSTVKEAYSSNRWFYVTAGKVRGFVHSSRVSNQVSVPNCSTHRGIAAARWAAERVGNTMPTTAEKRGIVMDRWSGYCYVFAADAHILGYNNSPIVGKGSAKATFAEYKRLGLVSTNIDANAMNIGSIVFWTFGTYGHAAIYVGNGYVISTQGDGSKILPIARLPLSTWNAQGAVAGWVAPANV